LADDVTNDVLKFWSDYEATARTGKNAARVSLMRGAEASATPAPLVAAWDMIQPHVDDNYTFVDPWGNVSGKNHLEELIQSGEGVFAEYKRGEHVVRQHGDTVIYVSAVTLSGQRDGQDVSGSYRETHTLVKRDHGWVVLASQMTKIDPGHVHPLMAARKQ